MDYVDGDTVLLSVLLGFVMIWSAVMAYYVCELYSITKNASAAREREKEQDGWNKGRVKHHTHTAPE